ncbi:helix-turn-helix transcriptional regulator [Acrocarpospora sp. B8E8]|uniref:helix-turn-helix domain-containing protein n=1 Tax=Acrocarpospora sp. B8E8 TaxID=3153572 RepID=UPI00325D988C
MIDDAYGATIAKLSLSAILTDLRVARGLTASQVCEGLGWGRGKLGRFEANHWKRPELSDIRDLLRLYDIEPYEQERITELALLARKRPWWRDYGDVFETEYPGFENDAADIEIFSPLTIPALLQTRRYAEVQHSRLKPAMRARGRLVEAVLTRQRILSRDDGTAPTLIAVVTEAALLYTWGSPADRLEQIRHLARLNSRPHVDVRVHSFAAGPPPFPLGAVTLMRFRLDGPAVVLTDTGLTSAIVTDRDEVDRHAAWLRRLREQAHDQIKTGEYLAELTKGLLPQVDLAEIE